MSAINFVVRDVAGNISRGSVAGEGVPASLIVGAGADISLNLTRGQIVSYTRQGQALEITLIDGRVVTIEGFFTMEGVTENELFLSADGYLTEVQLTQGAGEDYFAAYLDGDGMGKFAVNDDLYFMRGADVMLADTFDAAGDGVGMLGVALGGLAPIFGLGGAAAAAGVAAIIGGVGGGDDGPVAPVVAVTSGAESSTHTVNQADHGDGVDIGGTGTPGGVVEVTVGGVTQTTTVDADGNWVVTFDPTDIEPGEYTIPVEVVITNENGVTTVTDMLVVDTIIGVDIEATGGADSVISATEHAAGITLNGTVTGGDSVVVTIDGVDYAAVVTGTTWTLDVDSSVLGEGEYTQEITVTATDAAGNSSSSVMSVVVDTVTSVTLDTAPVGGADNVVNGVEQSGGVTLTGTAQAGASVEVTFGTVVQTVIADASGNWSATYAAGDVPTGELDVPVTIIATDAAGNTATASSSIAIDTVTSVTLDTAPVGGADSVVNGVEQSGGVTLTGTAQAGASVEVTFGTVVQTVIADASGNWSATYAAGDVPTGELDVPVTIIATDAAGNTATASSSIAIDTVTSVTVDTTSVGGADSVVDGTEQANGVTLTGTAQAGASVAVTFGVVTQTVIADANGNWTTDYAASNVPTGDLDVPVTVVATDAAGNTATATSSVAIDTNISVTVDTSSVGGGDTVLNSAEQANGVTLTGTSDAGASVAVTFGTVTQTVFADANGNWTTTYASSNVPTGETDVPVTVVATDTAGNTATASSSVSVDTFVNNLDMTSNSSGGADSVVNFNESGQAISMTGTVEAGSTVSVNLNGVILPATVDAGGNWSVTYPGGSLPGGEYTTSVIVTATDAAGNTSSLSEPVIVDTVAGDLALSTQPIEIDDVVNSVEHADGVIISGTATAGLIVTVGLGSATQTVLAQPDGTWSLNFPASMVPQGTYESAITASIMDAAGNFKEVSDTVQIDTEVVPFNFSASPIEGDNVINGSEAADGVVLSGQVEAGSSVAVQFGGQTITVVAGSNGQWSANFPASTVAGGETTANMTATATDLAGNVSVITNTVQVDTIVNELTSTDPVEGDNIVNRVEASDGITLGGTVEVGSSVMVTFEGLARAATVDSSGNWTVTYAASEVPDGEYNAVVNIAATDAYGNTDSITDTFRVDTTVIDVPHVDSVTITADGVEYVGIDSTVNDVTVTEITETGGANFLADQDDGVALPWGETLFNFDPVLPNGSHLVVQESDDAGNNNATYVVLEETGTNTVDFAGLDGIDIGSIDLSFSTDSEVTLDLATLEGLSDADNNLFILGGTDDSVTLTGAANSGTSTTVNGTSYDIYTMGSDAQVYIEDGVNVTI